VLGIIDKPGLSWGAARETANYAVHHQNAWVDLPSDVAVQRLYRHHRGIWDHRALVGSALHTINAAWCDGKTIQVKNLVDEMCEGSRLWARKDRKDIYGELIVMSDGLADAWRSLRPETLSFEQVVRHRNGNPALDYVGQTDWRALVAGRPTLLELKTTGGTEPGTRKYWDLWRLQLAAYRFATEAVAYDDHDEERGSSPLPEVDQCLVVHLYGNGRFQVDPVRVEKEEHDVFLDLRQAYGWLKGPGQGAGTTGMLGLGKVS
jgi:hypothetical protein